jgi:hypothetical protein
VCLVGVEVGGGPHVGDEAMWVWHCISYRGSSFKRDFDFAHILPSLKGVCCCLQPYQPFY